MVAGKRGREKRRGGEGDQGKQERCLGWGRPGDSNKTTPDELQDGHGALG